MVFDARGRPTTNRGERVAHQCARRAYHPCEFRAELRARRAPLMLRSLALGAVTLAAGGGRDRRYGC